MPEPSCFDSVCTHLELGMIFVNIAQTARCVGHAIRYAAAKSRAEEAYEKALYSATSLPVCAFARLQPRLEELRGAIETLPQALFGPGMEVQISPVVES